MSTVMNQARATPVAITSEAPRPPWGLAFAIAVIALAFVALVKWYQHAFSWTVGTDSFSPEFQVYWMRIFYAQIIGLPLLGAVGAAWLWFSRDRNIQDLPAHDELARFYAMFSILVVAAIVLISALGLLTEADAAWHQVVIRDTDFTPTHIFLFYLGIPAGLGGLMMAWIWVHTRLPYFANRVSLPLSLAIIGFMMAGPVVAFNEWAHTFFYAEELFAAPVHWFFVLAGFFLVFLIGFVIQCVQRMYELSQGYSLEEVEREMGLTGR